MKYKILFVLENYYPKIGGVETLFKNLCEGLAQKGYGVTVLTSGAPGCTENEILNGVKIQRLKTSSRYAFTFLAFFEALKHAQNYDLIHTTSYNAALPAFLGAKFSRKKVLITFHEMWGTLWFSLPFLNKLSKLAHYLFEKLIAALPFDKFIAVSKFTYRRLIEEGVEQKRIEFIYNGIDYGKIDDFKLTHKITPYENFTYTYFGRSGVSKGLDLLFEAAAQIRTQIPNSQFLLVTPKENHSVARQIDKLIDQYNLRDYIRFKQNLLFFLPIG